MFYDLKDKKLTLPLLYSLRVSSSSTKKEIIKIIKSGKSNKDFSRLIEIVNREGGIQYATNKMNQFREEGLEILNAIPQTKNTSYLESLVNFVVERKN